MLANRATWKPSGQAHAAHASRSAQATGAPLVTLLQYAASAVFVALLGTALWKSGITQPNIFSTVPFILAVLFTAFLWGRGPAVMAAVASGATFNYYYIGSPYRFEPPTAQEWFLFIAMLTIGVGLGTVTDRMRHARREAAELAASERFQKTLLSSISHDLRTPLTAIMGSLTTLLAEKGPVGRLDAATRQELLSIAYGQTQALNRLVEQLLEMTRLEAGVVRLQREPAPLQDLLRLALSPMGADVARRYRVKLAPGIPPVQMDIILLSHAVRNVLDNAARYSPPEDPIEVEAAAQSGEVVLSVADRGPGIPSTDLAHVFEKFYQLPRTAGGMNGGGAGLGLAIAKGIVEAHAGRIWAEQREGGGTIVRLTLPLA